MPRENPLTKELSDEEYMRTRAKVELIVSTICCYAGNIWLGIVLGGLPGIVEKLTCICCMFGLAGIFNLVMVAASIRESREPSGYEVCSPVKYYAAMTIICFLVYAVGYCVMPH